MLVLAVVDATAVMLAIAAALIWSSDAGAQLIEAWRFDWLSVTALLVGSLMTIQLYPGAGFMPADELRRIVLSSGVLFLAILIAMLAAGAQDASAAVSSVAMAWVATLLVVPLGRAALRSLVAERPWWGEGVIVLGAGTAGEEVARALRRQPTLGLKPLVLLTDRLHKSGDVVSGIPVIRGLALAPKLAEALGARFVIVALRDFQQSHVKEVIDRYCREFPRQILAADAVGLSNVWVSGRDLGELSAVEVRQELLRPGSRALKRIFDLMTVGVLCVPAAVSAILIAILIKVESTGPVFFKHDRIGHRGQRFCAWKFRTMVDDADVVLDHYLQRHPELKAEWERSHKLRDDPRVTRVGRLLRRTSLDELPQMWNVIRGEMSMVGPRPIVEQEKVRYGVQLQDYLRVRPGITGLWQVSGRNDIDYRDRVALDTYYVRNWSLWLDLHVLASTPAAVVRGRGAY
jgi:Undecaprenyl-phosphate galactose phosphotransferase WbaP